jgi:hypothetical protein
MAITLACTPHTSDASVSITAGGLSGITSLSITRSDPDGSTAPVRSATAVATGGASTLAFFDFEAPLDQSVTYTLTPSVGSPVTSSAITIVTNGSTFWLKNVAQEALSRTVEVAGMSAIRRPSNTLATYHVLGRKNPVIISDVRGGRVGTMTLTAPTLAQTRDLLALLGPGTPLLFQAPASTGFEDMYFTVTGDVEETWLGTAGNPVHGFSIPFTEVDAPTDDLVAVGANSWALVVSFGTWANLLAKRSTWLDVLNRPFTQGDAA